jgi:hypothetical protein
MICGPESKIEKFTTESDKIANFPLFVCCYGSILYSRLAKLGDFCMALFALLRNCIVLFALFSWKKINGRRKRSKEH